MIKLVYTPPKSMVTPFNRPMSERARRIYGWLNSRGLSLTTFSTDDMVKAWMPGLEEALKVLEGYEQDAATSRMVIDLKAIMGRVPQARATRESGQEATGLGTAPANILDPTAAVPEENAPQSHEDAPEAPSNDPRSIFGMLEID